MHVISYLLLFSAAVLAQPVSSLSLTITHIGPNTGATGITDFDTCNPMTANPATCVFSIPSGTSLTLSANSPSPSTPGVFSGGSGSAAACATSTCSFTITADSALTTTFNSNLGPFPVLTITLAGTGTGVVYANNGTCQNSNPSGYSGCATKWASGSVVTLKAVPPAGTMFSGFSGACVSGTTGCSFTITGNSSVTASFTAVTPVFPMVVTGSITPTVANINAAIQYRPQDVGSTGSVYVFALAPANLVTNAAVSLDKHIGPVARGSGSNAKETPVACVLAQLTAGGQLTAATAGSLQAYLTGVLGSQGASIAVLNNISTALVQGSVFYVGYGANSLAAINGGINRSVVTVPGTLTCQPQAPETGWWWNKNEGGRGFSIEAQGNHLFMAGYLYDVSGRATWTISGGLNSLDGSLYNSTLATYSNGQTLTGSYRAPGVTGSPGPITLSFTDARNGTLIWPGGSIPIERFDSILPPLPSGTPAPAFEPEDGWWWNAGTTDNHESGRGYFMEFKNKFAFIAGYMYDASGNPLWYLSSGNMPAEPTFQGNWSQFAGGQTLTGTYKAPGPAVPSGALYIQFQDAQNAMLTLPDGRVIPITRFRF